MGEEPIIIIPRAFLELSQGTANIPLRSQLDLKETNGLVLVMPCHGGKTGNISLKSIYQFAENPVMGLPLIQSLLILADEKDGQILNIMNGAVVTALRTGAVAGLATGYLARPESTKVAILGAGIQGKYQLRAVAAVRKIKEAWVFDLNGEAADRFSRETSKKLQIPLEPAETPRDVLKKADIICTATTFSVPMFEDKDIEPGTHINGIGSWHPNTREFPPETILRYRIFVESRKAAMVEAGDLILPVQEGLMSKEALEDRLTQLGAQVFGKAAGRKSSKQVTLFKLVGLAVEDLFFASYIYDVCRMKGIGQVLIP